VGRPAFLLQPSGAFRLVIRGNSPPIRLGHNGQECPVILGKHGYTLVWNPDEVGQMRRSEDWLRQAQRDLRHAVLALNNQDYEWACFAADQAAKKAVKALLQSRGIAAWGSSVTHLLNRLPKAFKPSEILLDKAKELDRHYIPARYPDAYPEGAPMDYYTQRDAEGAVNGAREVIEFVNTSLQRT